MPSKYWIKLYHEIIDDPKMARLSDRLYRRLIELFLLAGEQDDDGRLPPIEDMAWKLRLDIDELTGDLVDLEKYRFIHKDDDEIWYVTNFAKRQSPVPGAERVARFRDRKRKEEYYGTPEKQGSNANETERYTDTDTDIDTDKESEEELNGTSADAELPEPPPKIKKGKKRDPLLDHPAIIAYREEARLHVPIPWREEVCNTVDDPEIWRELVHDWIGHGWNKQNIKGLLQAYRNGGIDKRKTEPAGFAGIRDYIAEEQEQTQDGN